MPKDFKNIELRAVMRVLKAHADDCGPRMYVGDIADVMGWSNSRTFDACVALDRTGDVKLQPQSPGSYAQSARLVEYLVPQPPVEDVLNALQMLSSLQADLEEHFEEVTGTNEREAEEMVAALRDARRTLDRAVRKLQNGRGV
jgi:hypothetical protein